MDTDRDTSETQSSTAGTGTTGRRLVVAFDGSPGSEIALDWAAAASRRENKPLTVLYCFEMPSVPLAPIASVELLPDEVREEARSITETGVKRARALTKPSLVTGELVIGTAAAELVLSSKDAEVVVIGSRGRGRMAAGLLGSASYAVAAHALCPVVVVRGGYAVHPDPVHPVVVGVDDSEASHRAVERAADVAARSGATLQVITVGRLRSPEGWAYVEDSKAGSEHSHAVREHAQPIVDAARERALSAHPELTVDAQVLFGEAGHVLAVSAVHAGLLVVGSRGRGGFAGLLLGSVSHTVIHEASCPVMVVR